MDFDARWSEQRVRAVRHGMQSVSAIDLLSWGPTGGWGDRSQIAELSAPCSGESMNYSTDFTSVRGSVSTEEWKTRCDLAACYRLMDSYGMTDLIYNHITARIPGTEHLLINLYGLLYREITASSLVKID